MSILTVPIEIYREVRKTYLKGLPIPPSKSKRPFFLCPVGYVGAGKSTVLALLEKHLSFVRLSTDELRRLFRERGYGQPGSLEAKQLFDELIEHFAEAGYNIAFDANCGSAKDLIEARAKRLSIQVIWLHIDPPESFILHKLKTYPHTWLFRDATHAIERYFYHKKRMPSLTPFSFLYTFDPSRADLQTQVKDCTERIKTYTRPRSLQTTSHRRHDPDCLPRRE